MGTGQKILDWSCPLLDASSSNQICPLPNPPTCTSPPSHTHIYTTNVQAGIFSALGTPDGSCCVASFRRCVCLICRLSLDLVVPLFPSTFLRPRLPPPLLPDKSSSIYRFVISIIDGCIVIRQSWVYTKSPPQRRHVWLPWALHEKKAYNSSHSYTHTDTDTRSHTCTHTHTHGHISWREGFWQMNVVGGGGLIPWLIFDSVRVYDLRMRQADR